VDRRSRACCSTAGGRRRTADASRMAAGRAAGHELLTAPASPAPPREPAGGFPVIEAPLPAVELSSRISIANCRGRAAYSSSRSRWTPTTASSGCCSRRSPSTAASPRPPGRAGRRYVSGRPAQAGHETFGAGRGLRHPARRGAGRGPPPRLAAASTDPGLARPAARSDHSAPRRRLRLGQDPRHAGRARTARARSRARVCSQSYMLGQIQMTSSPQSLQRSPGSGMSSRPG
jgi:hypothetical protein